jgi:hypothetical protein
MIANKLKKISGIIRLKIIKPDFNVGIFKEDIVYMGCLCLNTKFGDCIFTNYIPGIINADFFTCKEISKFQNNEISWEDSNKLKIHTISKQWDYVSFKMINPYTSNFISFPKINKILISSNPSLNTDYKIYGSINTNINIIKKEKINMIHDKLPAQVYYLCDKNNSYSGSLIYRVNENLGNFNLEILGLTSNDYSDYGRIIPLDNLEYTDSFIKLSFENYNFSNKDIFEIPIVRKTTYPILTSNYLNLLKKNDIIIKINDLHITNMSIINYKLDIYQTIDEYFTYINQNNPICKLLVVRYTSKINIFEVNININIFKIKQLNDIYLDIHDLYVLRNIFKFSSDVSDYMLENEIYNDDIVKYLNDFNYKISEIRIE